MSKKKDKKDKANRTGVISCRLPGELKQKVEVLARNGDVVLSHVLRDFMAECIERGDFYWWCAETHLQPLQDAIAQTPTEAETDLKAEAAL